MRERSLAGLVAAAASRCRGDVAGQAGEITRLASVGLFDQARRLTRLTELRPDFLAELSGFTVESINEMREQDTEDWETFSDHHWAIASAIEEEPCWQALSEACELADRIDQFLAHFDHAAEWAPLARACQVDTALLGILADWMLDRQQTQAGEEARHLRGLCDTAALGLPRSETVVYSDFLFETDLE